MERQSDISIRRFSAIAKPVKGWILPVALLVAWELASKQSNAYAQAFVPLEKIGASLLEVVFSGELFTSLLASLGTATTGLLVGGAAGLSVGSLMGLYPPADKLIGPVFHAVRQVPLLGWIPLIGLWFGNGSLAKTLVVCLGAFYPMVLNTYEGLRNVEKNHLEAGEVLGVSRWQSYRYILIPGALPFIFTGVFHALAFSWISTVGSELLFSAGPGLGGLMQTAQMAARMDIVIICVASIGVTGLLMNFVFTGFSRRLLRWRATR
ncbi:ABC transporter permease [Candidatus Methylospira mobilis]|uniref:ABC transporter permease n=1 Tax=Candidatus Methylospira mobilis TaxID=1808979 RepID=A0A5Q0BKU4_9GAMM|nr:ABC transporter permease [Candidatus Methylospira mobilis]QFY42737.1 ABC transporter permease [Candidatus Methylospira mobilis]WNV04138.1 ABC transporter permease [Candidatus Methylospira mobilis]